MVIAFGGRCKSGKTEMAKLSEKYGFERIYFAQPLKILIAHLINGTVADVDNIKNIDGEYMFNDEQINFISTETNIPLEIVEEKIKGHLFKNTREMMQYIGTDLIRAYNEDWHVNKISESIDVTKKYIIDDLRFPNEKRFLESIGAFCFYVVRPSLEYISNHESETSLKWQDFDNIIVNKGSLEYLLFNWENFIKNGIGKSIISRSQLLNKIYNDPSVNKSFMNEVEPFNIFDSLFINQCEFTYNPKFYMNGLDNVEKLENFNNSIFRVYYTNGETEIVTNPLMIEDLKKYYETKI